MACSRGKASPNTATTQRLYMDSGGFCQRPECAQRLFVETATKHVHVAEMAHVFAAIDGGPRTNKALSEADRGTYDNLILLCANCHTVIDKAPDAFPDDLILKWKKDHVARLEGLFGVAVFDTRAKAREAVDAALRENRLVHEKYNPSREYNEDPESDMADAWRSKVLATILPNNRKILLTMATNRHLLTDGERDVMAAYQQHIADLETRHLTGDAVPDAQLFPSGMSDIFK